MNELAKAFEKEPEKSKVKPLPIVVFIIGLITLVTGVVFLVLKLAGGVAVSDAKKIVEIGTFMKDGEEGVIWNFTEDGKGKLTTNNHANDYDFAWTIEDGKLKIQTAWLYDLDNEYDYKIEDDKLVLDEKIVFVPAN